MELTPIYIVSAITAAITIIFLAYILFSLYSYKERMIKAGLDDEEIIREHSKKKGKIDIISDFLSVAFTVFLLIITAVSIYARANNNFFLLPKMGTLNVVASGSMSYRHENNEYLIENNLTSQIDVYDVIAISPVENEENIQLYDVVVYKSGERYVVHRIIDIRNQNGEKQFILRGDANKRNDNSPITFNEILGKYDGFRIPLLGVFVIFLQSTQGYIAVGLVVLMTLYTFILEKKLNKTIVRRLEQLGIIEEEKTTGTPM